MTIVRTHTRELATIRALGARRGELSSFVAWQVGVVAASATVVALVHDTIFTLAAIGFAHYIAGTAIGHALLIEPFRINLTLVAAILTIMGYSIRTEAHRYTEWRKDWKNPETATVIARELYDHVKDPRETTNIADKPEQAEIVKALAEQLKGGWKKAM